MAFLDQLPEFASSDNALVQEPDTDKKKQGWTTNTNTDEGEGEYAPLEYFNWIHKLSYRAFLQIKGAFGSITQLGTMASQDADNVAITGGNINDTNCNTPTTGTQIANKDYVDNSFTNAFFTTGMKMLWDGPYYEKPDGWIIWEDGTIGSPQSKATVRADNDVKNLFGLYWRSAMAGVHINGDQPRWYKLYNSDGTMSAFGKSWEEDWAANKAITLPVGNGRVPANKGGNFNSYGYYLEELFYVENTTQISFWKPYSNTGHTLSPITDSIYNATLVRVYAENGGELPKPLQEGADYYLIYVSNNTYSLAASRQDALDGKAITFTSNGHGDLVLRLVISPAGMEIGQYEGERQHAMSVGEMAKHRHTPDNNSSAFLTASEGGGSFETGGSGGSAVATNYQGASNLMNIMPPVSYGHYIIKL
jgi:hypothetical protein